MLDHGSRSSPTTSAPFSKRRRMRSARWLSYMGSNHLRGRRARPPRAKQSAACDLKTYCRAGAVALVAADASAPVQAHASWASS